MIIKIAFFVKDFSLLVPKGTTLEEVLPGLYMIKHVPQVEAMQTVSAGMVLELDQIGKYV